MPRAIGSVSTSSASKAPVTSTAYTEQTSGAQRSLKSSSASDAAAGTGARTVRISYFTLASDGTIRGPYYETVTLNGTTAVLTVATNIALIESIVVLTAGSGGVPAGTISLYANTAGTGTVIASIATGAVATALGHHYVATGKQCRLVDLSIQGGDAAAALVEVDVQTAPFVATSHVEQDFSGQFGTTATLPQTVSFAEAPASPIVGPARMRLQVTPANTNAQQTTASFGYVDTTVDITRNR